MVDLTALGTIIGLLNTTAVTANSGTELYRSIKGKKPDENATEIMQVASELADQLYQARATMLQVQVQLQSLQRNAEAEDRFEETLAKYQIVKTERGGSYYGLREPDPDGHLFDKVCPICAVDRRQFFPLQDGTILLTCNKCGTDIAGTKLPPIPRAKGRKRY